MKKNLITVVFIILIISSFFLLIKVNQYEEKKAYTVDRGIRNINTAVSYTNKLTIRWEELDDYTKNFYISSANEHFARAIENLNDADKYFYQVEEHKNYLHTLRIKMDDLPADELYDYLLDINDAINCLNDFISKSDLYKLSQEELIESWEYYKKSLK